MSHRRGERRGARNALTRGLVVLAAIALVDRFLLDRRPLALHGLADELGHLLTAYVWLGLAEAAGLAVSPLAVLAGGVAIDLDHLPLILRIAHAPAGTSRPVSHSLLTVLVLLALAGADRQRRRVWASLALGVASHLVRDLGTGAVPLFWPLPSAPIGMPYECYLGLTVVLVLGTAMLLRQSRRCRRAGQTIRTCAEARAGRRRVAALPAPAAVDDSQRLAARVEAAAAGEAQHARGTEP